MKVKSLVDYHDTTIGKVYDVLSKKVEFDNTVTVIISDDVYDHYDLFDDEYEVVDE